VNFKILIDKSFCEINTDFNLSPINNKHVLSLANDFESGEWRYGRFQNYIWDNIAETALSKSERDKLINKPNSLLVESAKKLRITNDVGKGSELCEILLYGIMKDHYSALPVVPKIFYKQNANDNAKGSDSVHIVVENDGKDFSLWFGEAKFYTDIDSAIYSAVKSVDSFIRNEDQIKKENSIITSMSDLGNMDLSSALLELIRNSLSGENSLDNIKSKINIPILLLHECNITEVENEFTNEYQGKIIDFHRDKANKYFEKQVNKMADIFKYADIKFHLILFPIPNKKAIVDSFVKNADHHRSQ
jgi:hypothetical protein